MPPNPLPGSGGYTVDELARLYTATAADVRSIVTRIDALLERMDDRYQRRDLAEALAAHQESRVQTLVSDIETVSDRLDDVKKAREQERLDRDKEARAMRRLVLGALVLPVLATVVAGLILAVVL